MKISRVILHAAGVLTFAAPCVFAGQAPVIHQRKENQQDRIGNGVKDGQLTPAETRNLEGKESAINKEEHAMKTANGGKLTAADRARLQHQQNRVSRDIYRKKHNARTE